MKWKPSLRLAFCLSFFMQFYILNADPLPLNDALKFKKAEFIFRGNSGSTHYLEPIVVDATNLTNETLTIVINVGDEFIPANVNEQNIVVTQSEILVLKPKDKKTLKIKGMCTEQSDASGNGESIYSFQTGNNEKMRKLASFIASKKYQSSASQYAVWCLINNSDINSIYSSDTTEENELKIFLANLTGKTFVVKSKDYRYNYYAPPKERTGGNFEYSFSKAKDIQIAMFDKNGILVRELFNQKKVAPGNHQLKFEFDSSVYTDEVYYFKLIVENDVLVSRKWDVQAMRDSFKKKIENRE